MAISLPIDAFLARYIEKKFSPRTIELYDMVLQRFQSFLVEAAVIDPVSKSDASAFLIEISKTNNAISTNQYLCILRLFYNWRIKFDGYEAINPFEPIPSQKEPHLLPVFLMEHERRLLYQLVEEDPKIKVKDVIMLDVFIGTGIRTTELCFLKISDFFIDGDDGFFRLRVAKGMDEREVIMPEFTRDQVRRLIHMLSISGFKEEWLFPNLRGGQLTRQGVYNRISRMVSKVKSRKKGAHTLRHTFATWAMDRDVPLSAVQKQLGHKNPNSTARYTHTSTERIKKVFNRSHPKA